MYFNITETLNGHLQAAFEELCRKQGDITGQGVYDARLKTSTIVKFLVEEQNHNVQLPELKTELT